MLQKKRKKNTAPASPGLTAIRKEFLAKLIPWGMAMLAEAEGYGIEWRRMTVEQMMGEIIFAKEWAKSKEVIE